MSISRSRVLLSLLISPQASPENSYHMGGWVWASSWHEIRGFSTNHPNPNRQVASHCKLTSDTISVELVPIPQVELSRLSYIDMNQPWSYMYSVISLQLIKINFKKKYNSNKNQKSNRIKMKEKKKKKNTVLTSDASHVVSRYHVSDQGTESWTFHHRNSMLKNSVEPATKLRKPLTHSPHFKLQDKIRNSEMEETFKSKGEWRWVEPSWPGEHGTLTSTLVPTSLAIRPNIYGLLLRFHSTGISIESSARGDWSQSQCPPIST